ncbi:MAG: hypothetical protein R3B09_32055 [Nannocystaceae bacterium]
MRAFTTNCRVGVAFVIALAAASACGDEASDQDIEVWSGEYIDYEWAAGMQPCDSTLESLDAFVPFVAEQLGLDPATFERITYRWETYESYQGHKDHEGTLGYSSGNHAYSFFSDLLHELVHTVVHQRRDGGLSFLREGFASALDATSIRILVSESWGPRPRYNRVDPRPYIDDTVKDDGGTFYGPAAAFVAYLLSRHGSEPLFELHAALTWTSSPERFADAFREIYDLDLDHEIEVFLTDDTCPDDATTSPQPFACAAPTVPWTNPNRWEDVRPVICVDGGATGGHEIPMDSVTVEVPEAGLYRFDFFGEDRSGAILLPCGRCPWLAEDTYLVPGSREVPLAKGLHAITYRAGLTEPSYVGAALSRIQDPP